jgi:hypothetical protein
VNPNFDITALSHVEIVVKDGVIYKGGPALLQPKERNINAAGPVVAGDMMFVTSGYSTSAVAYAETYCWRSACRSRHV